MAMTRRSWYRVGGAVVVLAIVIGGTAMLWSQPSEPLKEMPRAVPVATAGTYAEVAGQGHGKPLGTWERKIGPLTITLRFDHDQLHGTINMKIKEQDVKEGIITFRTDYSVTKDAILYGVVSTVEVKMIGKKKIEAEDLLKLGEGIAALQGQPFCMHYRQDGDELLLKDLKFFANLHPEQSSRWTPARPVARTSGVAPPVVLPPGPLPPAVNESYYYSASESEDLGRKLAIGLGRFTRKVETTPVGSSKKK